MSGEKPAEKAVMTNGGAEKASSAEDPESSRDAPAWRAARQCAEVVSVMRVRDAMGSGLEPMMGMLRYIQKLADGEAWRSCGGAADDSS